MKLKKYYVKKMIWHVNQFLKLKNSSSKKVIENIILPNLISHQKKSKSWIEKIKKRKEIWNAIISNQYRIWLAFASIANNLNHLILQKVK